MRPSSPFFAKGAGALVIVVALLLAATAALWGTAQAQSGVVRGRVTDEAGRPVAGAQVGAFYQSFGGGQLLYGGSYNRQAVTGPDGRYSISLQGLPRGEYAASGDLNSISLLPENPTTFASNAVSVRNFTYRIVESTSENEYGNGAILAVANDIGEFTDLAGLELTLRSRETGQVYTKTVRRTGEGYAVTGLPFGSYEVSGRLNGRPVGIKPHSVDDDPFRSSVVLSVRPGDIPRVMRAMIKP
ncbi:MAG: carboxypeptidase regulatory-like domain-containing protein [Brevundimonas sp.]|uniref:carboxypeptidase-like regulatory domain-containing protein n=1 Tax=Brevundimonas sp. TaxID=1871086 RepID=UPI001212A500|nr:carboxypeptidase-like regulatory domain-containing protein [Brevundimonas sp.]RZJ16547.1 MAG: carboxypeptidase regulatory-like domain-containing protein [Brevundimonas sp.]